MPTVDEIAAGAASPMNAQLRRAIEDISGWQTVTFTKYTRTVIPADGFVFFVRSSLQGDATPALTIQGSLHVSADNVQEETTAYTRTAVILTSKEDAGQGFFQLGPADLMIGSVAGVDGPLPIRFAFSRLGFYQNAGIYHYSGIAVIPAMAAQIVDTLAGFDTLAPVVSNSLPAWLHLSNYTPTLPAYGFGNTIPLYPSFLVTPNLVPPFGSVHIAEDGTEALGGAPYLGATSSHYQLARDRVTVTLYGVRSDAALTFLDCCLQYMGDYQVLGLGNAPVVRDAEAPATGAGSARVAQEH